MSAVLAIVTTSYQPTGLERGHAATQAANDNVPCGCNVPRGFNSHLRLVADNTEGTCDNQSRIPASARPDRARQTHAYDMSDQPTYISGTAQEAGSGATGTINGTYKYDGNLKRVKSVVDGKTIYNVYDAGGTLIHIDKVTDGKKTDYIGKVARVTTSGGVDTVTYLHADQLGSANTGTDANGLVTWREQYTPFGITLTSPLVNTDQAGFTGHIKDSATGLNYMQARYFDPLIGRFLSIDPMTFTGSGGNPNYFNRYAYSFNDPVNNIDPDGRIVGKAIKFVRNTIKAKGNPIKGFTETVAGAADDLGTLADGQLNLDDAAAVVSLVTGFDKKDQKAIGGASKKVKDKFANRRKPKSIQDKMTLDAAKTGQGDTIIPADKVKDANFKGMEKAQFKTKSNEGKDSVVNFMRKPGSKEGTDFKFKKRSEEP